MKDQITQIFNEFLSQRVLVLGDVMLDAYYFGKVDRISPEAPVPVVSVQSKERRAGGAANVALNLKNLGAAVRVCSVVGNDMEGEYLEQLFAEQEIDCDLIRDPRRRTTVKTRIIGNKQQVLRVDEEDTEPLDRSIENAVLSVLKEALTSSDILVIQDYNKGVLSPRVIRDVLKLAAKSNVPVVVDPKKEHFLSFKGVSLFKPNRKELVEGLNLMHSLSSLQEIEEAMRSLQAKIDAKTVMLTLSEDGTAILRDDKFMIFPAHRRKIIDVSGAGDSVISVAALCVGLGLNAQLTAELSNLAGGLVCEKLGVVPIDRDTLYTEALELMY